MNLFLLLLVAFITTVVEGHTYEYHWTLSTITADPDNKHSRPVIAVNNEWPLPQVRIHKGDQLVVHLHNNLTDPTSLHFHGLFQNGTSFMDGASMVSQCPIPPGETFVYNFTVSQTGTYWYHSHSVAEISDGFRGVLVVEDAEEQQELGYDDDFVITLSDWYHTPSMELVDKLIAPGSRGSEPHIDSALFNETVDPTVMVQSGRTYLLRLVNVGMSASEYFYIENHMLTIVEIDGVRVEPYEVDSLNIATGQRYGVLFTTKEEDMVKNYPMVMATNVMMHKIYSIGWVVYDEEAAMDSDNVQVKKAKDLNFIDDMELVPYDNIPLLGHVDHQVVLNYSMGYFTSDETRRYAFNESPFFAPKVPTLNTVFSGNSSIVDNVDIYGKATNPIIINKGETVEIVINSNDHMKHPFHLHGHNFQVVSKGTSKSLYNPDTLPSRPIIRDTVMIPGRGYAVLRFVADNPGVWFLHCHTDWHVVQGLGVVFIESPSEIVETMVLPEQNREICLVGGLKASGNAAGNEDLLDFTGEVLDAYVYNTLSSSSLNVPTPTQSAKPADSSDATAALHTGFPNTVPLQTKIKVLVIYFLVMLSLAVMCAFGLKWHLARRTKGVSVANEYVHLKD